MALFHVLLLPFISICTLFQLSNGVCTDPSKITIFAYYRELQENEELVVQPKTSLALVCCHPDMAAQLEWIDKENNEVIELRGDNTPRDKRKFSFIDDKERLAFIISNVSRTDNSTFTCKLKSKVMSSSVKLKVGHDLPNTKVEERFVILAKGKPYKIECQHRSYIEMPILWFYYDTKTNQGVRIMSDKLTDSVNVTEKRKYLTVLDEKSVPRSLFCQVQNKYEFDGAYAKRWLKISWEVYDPVKVKVYVGSNNEVYEGSRAELVCEFEVLPGSQQVATWTIDGNPFHSFQIQETKGRNSLFIDKYARKIGSNFTCSVESSRKFNEYSKSTTSSASLVPTYIPKPQIINADQLSTEVNKGQKAVLRCQVKNAINRPQFFKADSSGRLTKLVENSNYKITYSKESDYNDLIYTIEKATINDRGVYICSVSNRAGQVTVNGTLNVRSEPELNSGFKDKVVYFYQQQVAVTCVVTGYPLQITTDSLTFEVDGKKINNKTNNNEASLLNVTFWVKLDPKKESYTGYCVYRGGPKQKVLKEPVQFKVAPLPPKPEIKYICSGISEAVFKAKKMKLGPNPLPYEPIVREYYTIKLKNLQPTEDATGVSQDHNVFIKYTDAYFSVSPLKQSTEYEIEWSWANAFARVDSLTFTVSTKAPEPPEPVSDVEVWSNENRLMVQYKLRSKCIHAKVPDVKLVKIRVKRLEADPWKTSDFNIDNKNWKEAGNGKPLRAEIEVDNTKVDYIVEVATVNDMGTSAWTRSSFKAGTLGPSNQGYKGGSEASNLQMVSRFSLLSNLLCLAFVQRILLRHF